MRKNRRAAPEPLETNDVALIVAGTALWGVALVGLLIWQPTGGRMERWWWIAAAGFALGLVGIRYVVRRHRALDRARQDSPEP